MTDHIRQLREEAVSLVADLPGAVRKVSLRTGTCAVEVEWLEAAGAGATGTAPAGAAPPAAGTAPAPDQEGPDQVDGALATAHRLVRAPLVGTCYLAARPGAPPFVGVGDLVEPGQTLCIVEAMKLMNEIVADTRGRVVEILAGNAEPVEYDQPLVAIAEADATEAA